MRVLIFLNKLTNLFLFSSPKTDRRMVIKVVINRCYGGFGLSQKAREEYLKRSGKQDDKGFSIYDLERTDPILIQIVEELGEEANDFCSDLYIECLDDDMEGCWSIYEYDGSESISIDGSFSIRNKIARILYSDNEMSDAQMLEKIREIISPLPSQIKKSKVDALYSGEGPIAKHLAQKYKQ